MTFLRHTLGIAETSKSSTPLPRGWIIGLSLLALALGTAILLVPKPWEMADVLAQQAVDGKPLQPYHYAGMTLMWALGGSLILVVGILVTVKFWARPLLDQKITGAGAMPRWVKYALIGIVLLGGGLRWNLAHEGLWWDELWQTRNTTVGYYKGSPDKPLEERRFIKGSFERAFWLYRLPTNHPVASVPARAMHLLTLDENDPAKFNEFALRFPGYLAGLATIFLLGWLGWRVGGARVAILVALLIAIHPWHIRYGVDLRSYTWLALWTVIAMHCLQSLTHKHSTRWRPLALLGLMQCLIMWSSVQAVWLSIAIFGTAVFLAVRAWDAPERAIAIRRVFLVHLLAVIPFSILWSPLIPQTIEFLERYQDSHILTFTRFERLVGEVLFGFPESEDFFLRTPMTTIAASLVVGMGFIMGIRWLMRKRKNQVTVVTAVLFGGILALIYYAGAHTFFYQRFLIYLLPPILLTIACGWAHWSSGKSRQWLSVSVIGVALFLGVSWPEIKVLNTRPYEPLRDLAEAMDGPDIYPIGYSHGVEVMDVYLPQLHRANNRAELEAHLKKAAAAGKSPMVTYGHDLFNREIAPDGFELLDDRDRFEVVKTFLGMEPRFTYWVLMPVGQADTGSAPPLSK